MSKPTKQDLRNKLEEVIEAAKDIAHVQALQDAVYSYDDAEIAQLDSTAYRTTQEMLKMIDEAIDE